LGTRPAPHWNARETGKHLVSGDVLIAAISLVSR
jgi:hypothetical protein